MLPGNQQWRAATQQRSLDSDLARALAHPVRIGILRTLLAASAGLTPASLAQSLQTSTSTIRRHLRVLRDLGVVSPPPSGARTALARRVTLATGTLPHILTAMLGAAGGAHLAQPALSAIAAFSRIPLESILNYLASGVAIYSPSGELLYMNPAGGRMTHHYLVPGENVAARRQRFSLRLPDGTPMPEAESPSGRARRGETFADMECVITGRHGEETYLLTSGAPLVDYQGTIQGAIVIFSDITRIKALDRQRDEFLSIAAHELRTPLTSILGTLHVLNKQVDRISIEHEGERLAFARGLARISRQSQRINKLVEDILDITRIASGQLEFTFTPLDLVAVAQEAIDGQALINPNRALALSLPASTVEMRGDASRLGQMFDNLISNALKYSKESQPVEVRLAVLGNSAHLTVTDHGPGIPSEYLAHLGERFFRVPGMTVRSGSGLGLGLGLFITYNIVERHGGKIWPESKPGVGTTFHVELPLSMQAASAATPNS